jgi:putative transcriptional regulator
LTKSAFDKIATGLNDAVAITEGRADPTAYRVHAPDTVDVRAMRKVLKMTQGQFAASFGLPLRTVQGWEQGKTPDPATRVLLRVIEREPDAVRRALDVA